MRIIGNDPDVPRQTQGVASGALANGKPVVVNADGTLSIAGTVAQNVGSGNQFNTDRGWEYASAYDSHNKRVVILYQDNANNRYLTAIVGTVSGNSVSFGTAVVIKSDEENEYGNIVFDSTNNKIVVVYRDDNASASTYYGAARVGTVDPSDNSISFGTKVVFNSGSTNYIASCFDSTNGKVFIMYRNHTGNAMQAIIGTVSGTNITFGSAATFNNGKNSSSNACVHDPDTNKIILFHGDTTQSNDPLYATVATVSGTSLSYGSNQVTVENGNYPPSSVSAVYDTVNQRVVIAYYLRTALYAAALYIKAGTVSGDTTSFGSSTQLTCGTGISYSNHAGSQPSITYDPSAGKILFIYSLPAGSDYSYFNVATVNPSDNSVTFAVTSGCGNSPYGTSLTGGTAYLSHASGSGNRSCVYDPDNKVIIVPYTDNDDNNYAKVLAFTNARATITSENYIGVSRSGAADGGTVLVNTQGAIADNLSGLTAGQSYYVQTDGTFSTTPDDPSVFAGTAVSATKLIVKG